MHGLIRAHELERRDGTEPVSVPNQAAAFARISLLRGAAWLGDRAAPSSLLHIEMRCYREALRLPVWIDCR